MSVDNNKPVALVTGASSGIGKETAKHLIRDGYLVYCTARTVEHMQDLAKLGGIVLPMDVTKQEDVDRVADVILKKHGALDVLVNNAGYGLFGAIEDITLEDAEHQMAVNLFGIARVTKAFIASMREKRKGAIVNISSMAGEIYSPLGAWYHASKHAVEGWSDCLRFELEPFNVKVIIIQPGFIYTNFHVPLVEPLIKRSGHTAYKEMAHKTAKINKEIYREEKTSAAHHVAEVISKALKAKHPKYRYRVGKFATLFIMIRRIFGDYVWDRLLKTM